ncbi:MAG: hypothetical protein AVDCRST_MAG91-690 [uncultured Sphingomonadaceae bacterium]|uniref:Uncharacterized protein n=1 Tax=uncultured Sphingomonadaceae bacterium TaxID=169976 RepID=A0A6J4SK41_9SPHN|nr:MAG: hypothetical protein AVDCRST_MAG91-690 [uncultured Sphingomonadaceae bacterium]
MPCRLATYDTLIPGRYVSSTIRTFSSGVQRLRRSTPDRTSPSLYRLVVCSVICLALS